MTAAQYNALKLKYYTTKRLKTGTQQSRVYEKHDEKIDHITPAYSILANEDYIKRQERVRAQMPLNISNETGVKEEEELWYEHVGETSRDATVTTLWINKRQLTEPSLTAKQTS